jgi:hypothetical protein
MGVPLGDLPALKGPYKGIPVALTIELFAYYSVTGH